MKNPFVPPLISGLALLLSTALLGQGTMPPPPLIQLVREEVKPGHGAAHAATESAWTQIMAKGKSTDHYIGMTSMTGSSEALFFMGYASYADYEAKQNEFDANPAAKAEVEKISREDGEHLTSIRTWLGSYRKDLSYGPDVVISRMRYFRVRTFRVKQGQNKAFEAGVKTALAAYEKSRYPASFAFYQITAGTGGPTYMVFRPMKSLAEMDAAEVAEKAFQEALGEAGQQAMTKTFADTVNSVENQLYSFSPKLSYPGPKTVAGDPAFWTVKPN